MYYRHNLQYVYPQRSDQHMLNLERTRTINLDDKYEYMPHGAAFKIQRVVVAAALNLIVFPLTRLTHGLRIYGKKNIRKHKKELKDGAITVSNHVFMWDYLCVLKAIRPHLSYFPAWKPNFESRFQPYVRIIGGIPIPEDDIHAMISFKRGLDEVVSKGHWLHVFPEGSMWYFYPDIRPLKISAFNYAVKYDKPLIPISMSFRERRGINKIFGKGPCVDLHISEPINYNKAMHPRDAAEDLRKRTYHIMQEMNGIFPGDPTYNEDQSIENYKKTM